MKKNIIILTAFTLLSLHSVNACDVCGCGVGNFNPHMFPHLSKNYITLNYNYRYFKTHSHDGAGEEHTEYYHTFQFATQFRLSQKLQVMAVLPFQSNRQMGNEGPKSLQHFGDAILLGNYRIADSYTGQQKNVRHTLLAGIGIKLPTGDHNYDENNEEDVQNANFQAGTGSSDLLLNGSYNIRFSKWTISSGVIYKINGSNDRSYRFGNRLLSLAQLKFTHEAGRYSLIPNLGFSYENMRMDKKEGAFVEHTGGRNFQLLAGLDVNNRQWAAGFIYQRSLAQNLADHHIHSMPGFNIHLSYSF